MDFHLFVQYFFELCFDISFCAQKGRKMTKGEGGLAKVTEDDERGEGGLAKGTKDDGGRRGSCKSDGR